MAGCLSPSALLGSPKFSPPSPSPQAHTTNFNNNNSYSVPLSFSSVPPMARTPDQHNIQGISNHLSNPASPAPETFTPQNTPTSVKDEEPDHIVSITPIKAPTPAADLMLLYQDNLVSCKVKAGDVFRVGQDLRSITKLTLSPENPIPY